MKHMRLLAAGISFVALGVLTTASLGTHHPARGRFLQRDPGDKGTTSREAPSFLDLASPSADLGGADNPASVSRGNVGSATINSPMLSMATLPAIPIPFAPGGQYRDGLNLYEYVRSDPVHRQDPRGRNIYLITGDDSTEWYAFIADRVHQNVCVDSCVGHQQKMQCFSYGKIGWAWYGPKKTWLGWGPYYTIVGGYVMEGQIDKWDVPTTYSVNKALITTPQEDATWLKYMRTKRVGTRDIYMTYTLNCRHYSQREFEDASLHIGR